MKKILSVTLAAWDVTQPGAAPNPPAVGVFRLTIDASDPADQDENAARFADRAVRAFLARVRAGPIHPGAGGPFGDDGNTPDPAAPG